MGSQGDKPYAQRARPVPTSYHLLIGMTHDRMVTSSPQRSAVRGLLLLDLESLEVLLVELGHVQDVDVLGAELAGAELALDLGERRGVVLEGLDLLLGSSELVDDLLVLDLADAGRLGDGAGEGVLGGLEAAGLVPGGHLLERVLEGLQRLVAGEVTLGVAELAAETGDVIELAVEGLAEERRDGVLLVRALGGQLIDERLHELLLVRGLARTECGRAVGATMGERLLGEQTVTSLASEGRTDDAV